MFIKKEAGDDRLNLLKKYYKLEKNTATVELYYDTFSELISAELGGENVERLNSSLISRIDEALSLVPGKYKIIIDVKIRNFENYSESECRRIIRENIMLKIYSLKAENRQKNRTSIFLAITGIGLLLLSYLFGSIKWPVITYDVINISGTLLVWEAVSEFVLERGDNYKRARQYLYKVKDVKVEKA